MYGYKHSFSEKWLDNDFQSPHFPNIDTLIAACYPSRAEFEAQHGSPDDWEKREISEAEIMQIFGGGSL